MREEVVVIDQGGGSSPVKVRRVKWYALHGPFPRCAWCKLNEVRMLVEIVQKGFTIDLIEAVCYCDSCHLATIVQFETPTEVEEESQETAI